MQKAKIVLWEKRMFISIGQVTRIISDRLAISMVFVKEGIR